MAAYSFVITDGPDEGRVFELQVGTTLVGRRDTPDEDDPLDSTRWVLTDPAVSRTHARVDWDGKRPPVLIHLSSTNATLLDGRIVTGQSIEDGQSLSNGNRLRMGQTGIEVQERSDVGRWCVLDRSNGDAETEFVDSTTSVIDGVKFDCQGAVVEVGLEDKDKEAYLLRDIDGQIWTTSLKPGKALSLKAEDIVRTEDKKLVLLDREAQ